MIFFHFSTTNATANVMATDIVCLHCGSAAVDGLGFQQDDSQIQILTVGHNSTEEGDPEPVMSCTHSQSKQDLRVTMLKKGTVGSNQWFYR